MVEKMKRERIGNPPAFFARGGIDTERCGCQRKDYSKNFRAIKG
jgi:hypothetical protein